MMTAGQAGIEPQRDVDANARLDNVKLLYKPFGLIFGIVAGVLAKKLFAQIWSWIDDEEPPRPTTERTTWGKVLAAALVEGVTFKVTRAAADRAGAASFSHLTGVWPGEQAPEPE